jgi:hypothetical protein
LRIERGLLMAKFIKGILIGALAIGLLTGCGINDEDQAKIENYDEIVNKYEDLKDKYDKMRGETQAESAEKQGSKDPEIGEYFEMSFEEDGVEIGNVGVRVVSVKETSERGAEEKSIEHIALVELELTNNTGNEIEIDSDDFNAIDSEGFQGKTFSSGYEHIKGDLWVTIPKDGKARAFFRYEVGTSAPYSVQVGNDTIIK